MNTPGDKTLGAWEMLAEYGIPTDVIDGVLHVHACELAGKQREWVRDDNFVPGMEVDRADIPTIVRVTTALLTDLIAPKGQA